MPWRSHAWAAAQHLPVGFDDREDEAGDAVATATPQTAAATAAARTPDEVGGADRRGIRRRGWRAPPGGRSWRSRSALRSRRDRRGGSAGRAGRRRRARRASRGSAAIVAAEETHAPRGAIAAGAPSLAGERGEARGELGGGALVVVQHDDQLVGIVGATRGAMRARGRTRGRSRARRRPGPAASARRRRAHQDPTRRVQAPRAPAAGSASGRDLHDHEHERRRRGVGVRRHALAPVATAARTSSTVTSSMQSSVPRGQRSPPCRPHGRHARSRSTTTARAAERAVALAPAPWRRRSRPAGTPTAVATCIGRAVVGDGDGDASASTAASSGRSVATAEVDGAPAGRRVHGGRERALVRAPEQQAAIAVGRRGRAPARANAAAGQRLVRHAEPGQMAASGRPAAGVRREQRRARAPSSPRRGDPRAAPSPASTSAMPSGASRPSKRSRSWRVERAGHALGVERRRGRGRETDPARDAGGAERQRRCAPTCARRSRS